MVKKTLKDLNLSGKKVLMRVDFNVPIRDGKITDDSRIRAALPSIQYILAQNGSLILMSHLGRPNGKKDPNMTLGPCARRLSNLLEKPVELAPDCVGPEVEMMALNLKPGQILLLENLRFHAAEEEPEKDPNFAYALSKLGNVYVDDAFGTAHRAHSSTAMVAKFFKERAMGFLMEKEIEALVPLIQHPERPFYAIIGGAKVSTKIGLIKKFLSLVDALFIGGGMTYTFLKAKGIEIGASICEDTSEIKDLPLEKIHLPLDLVIADRLAPDATSKIIPIDQGIPKKWQGVDIGPKTVEEWSKKLEKAKTIFWNGPLGVFEIPAFAKGTQGIAKWLSESKAKTIVGGGDSIAAIEQMELANRFFHLSTGGGASLEFLEFGHLPGIDALT